MTNMCYQNSSSRNCRLSHFAGRKATQDGKPHHTVSRGSSPMPRYMQHTESSSFKMMSNRISTNKASRPSSKDRSASCLPDKNLDTCPQVPAKPKSRNHLMLRKDFFLASRGRSGKLQRPSFLSSRGVII
eukprot:Blabericola_migrator_1__8254@NODE_427_length_8589_cov_62_998123_g337_i0_p8_GENE_NODE_427_length_8589_cov_62_998123_g337_i0NODE_427_length_8589_cov_62_998123_g337_i0_p8_ORF_typecomplete_len130_score8_02DUF4005/PF13178_6/7_2_NODE_427_length_8589_cov_62_998123_g337_i015191908